MFRKLFARNAQTVPMVDLEQLDLDLARINYADNQAMQLHFDRIQTSLNKSRTI